MHKVLFIANPVAGGKNKVCIVSQIERYLDSSLFEWSVEYTKAKGDATVLAKETDAGIVVAIGGDGTVDEVAKGIIGTDKILGIIPCGSGDGLALHLHISRNIKKAIFNLNEFFVTPIDYATINGEPFFCTCGVGFDAAVSWKFAQAGKRGFKTYIEESIKTWFKFKAQEYILEMDNCAIRINALLVTVGNANQWGNETLITPYASIRDGLLDVTVLEPFTITEAPLIGAQLLDGHIDKNPRAKCFKCRSITIKRQDEGEAHYDGEAVKLGKEIEIKIVPGAIRTIVPQKSAYKI